MIHVHNASVQDCEHLQKTLMIHKFDLSELCMVGCRFRKALVVARSVSDKTNGSFQAHTRHIYDFKCRLSVLALS